MHQSAARAGNGRGIPPARRDGQVIVIALLAMAVLVGLIFFVYNLGANVSRRVETQNAADAAVISGSTWIARSMNMVAMNNMAQSRMIALAPVLDALPLAVEITLVELQADDENQDALWRGVREQLQRGLPDSSLERGVMPNCSCGRTIAGAILFVPIDDDDLDDDGMPPRIAPDWPLSNDDRLLANRGTRLQARGAGFTTTGDWRSAPTVNDPPGGSVVTTQQGATARWETELPRAGRYQVYAWWPASTDGIPADTAAEFRIASAAGTSGAIRRNQNHLSVASLGQVSSSGTWIHLGDHDFPAIAVGRVPAGVELRRSTGDGCRHTDQPPVRVNFLRAGMERLHRDMEPGLGGQHDALETLHQAIRSTDSIEPVSGAYDISEMTHWRSQLGRGGLWAAAEAIDDLSQAAVSSAGLLAQASAVSYGEHSGAAMAMLVPVVPDLPAYRGTFADFHPVIGGNFRVTSDDAQLSMPVLSRVGEINRADGRLEAIRVELARIAEQLAAVADDDDASRDSLERRIEDLVSEYRRLDDRRYDLLGSLHSDVTGGGIGDFEFPHRLGPFARLMRWRYPLRRSVSDGSGNQRPPGGGQDPTFGSGWSPRPNRRTVTIGYRTYGPYRWALNQMHDALGMVGQRIGQADATRLHDNLRRVANTKLSYLFGVERQQHVRFPARWITDYDEARAFAANPENRLLILSTRYYAVHLMSSASWDHDCWLHDTRTFTTRPRGRMITPADNPPAGLWVWEPAGWRDMAQDRNASKVMDHVWRWQRQDTVRYDDRVSLPLLLDSATGEPIMRDRYMISWWIFGGIEVSRGNVPVDNPFNWRDGDPLPAPMLLDASAGEYGPTDQGDRRERFTFMGIARQAATAPVWTTRFSNPNPASATVAVAQAQVFNNRSWDLWTQDWQAQLMPVTQWDDWMRRLDEARLDAPLTGGRVMGGDVQAIYEYLSQLSQQTIDRFLQH